MFVIAGIRAAPIPLSVVGLARWVVHPSTVVVTSGTGPERAAPCKRAALTSACACRPLVALDVLCTRPVKTTGKSQPAARFAVFDAAPV